VLHGTPSGGNVVAVWTLSIVMILAMTAAQFFTQKLIMARSAPEEAVAGPAMMQQRIILYLLPVVFGAGGIVFPIGVLIYWTVSNLWTLAQQFIVTDRAGGGGRES
jgi:YidC/Oxa1 family membrane protein insertase